MIKFSMGSLFHKNNMLSLQPSKHQFRILILTKEWAKNRSHHLNKLISTINFVIQSTTASNRLVASSSLRLGFFFQKIRPWFYFNISRLVWRTKHDILPVDIINNNAAANWNRMSLLENNINHILGSHLIV